MESSIVTRKGQIVIPVEFRRKLGIKEGTRVFMEEKEGDIVIYPRTADFYDRTFGILKGGGLTKALLKFRREEKKHEERKFGKLRKRPGPR